MQIVIFILLLLATFMLIWLVIFSIYTGISLCRIADKLGVDIPCMAAYKRKMEEERLEEEENEKYTQLLQELSRKKSLRSQNDDNTYLGDYNELDLPDQVDQTETEPESVLKLLEFGLPDEEMAALLSHVEENI